MSDVDLMQYIRWAREKPSRSVKIEYSQSDVVVWVYDQVMGIGLYAVSHGSVIPASEIDLKAHEKERERKLYAALKRKFEGGNS